MKILMCGSALSEPGGMTSVCKQLVGHDWGEEFEIEYVPTHISGKLISKMLFFIGAYRKIKRFLRGGQIDAVHIHMSYKGSFYRKYAIFRECKRSGVPCILHMHGSEFKVFYSSANEKLKREIVEFLEGSSAVIALGQAWSDFFESIAPRAKIIMLRNSVPFSGYQERIKHEKFGIIYLGLLVKRKGVADLIEGFHRFLAHSHSYNAKLYIAGSGPEEASLRQLTNELGLSSQVEFLGWVDESGKADLLTIGDVFALTSYNEGLPMALLEAMSVGLPPIVTRVGSVPEAVSTGVEGFLVTPGNIDEIANSLMELYDDDSLWRSCSDAAQRKIDFNFNEAMYFRNLSQLYRRVCSREEETFNA